MTVFRDKEVRLAMLLLHGLAALCLSLAVSTLAHAQDAAHAKGLVIDQAWSRVTTPTARVGGGYLTITNHGPHDDRLLAVASEHSGKAEVHTMTMQDDVMIMRPVAEGLIIPAGETLHLAPGGFHLMFMQLNQPHVVDEPFSATLTFERAGSKDVTFEVLSMRDSMDRAAMRDGHEPEAEGDKH